MNLLKNGTNISGNKILTSNQLISLSSLLSKTNQLIDVSLLLLKINLSTFRHRPNTINFSPSLISQADEGPVQFERMVTLLYKRTETFSDVLNSINLLTTTTIFLHNFVSTIFFSCQFPDWHFVVNDFIEEKKLEYFVILLYLHTFKFFN